MKPLLYTLLLLTVSFSYATEIFSYKLKDNEKFISAQAVNFSSEGILHTVVVRNRDTKSFDLVSFYKEADRQIKQLATATFEDKPEMVSYHKVNNTVTLLFYHRNVLSITDIDLTSNTVTKKDIPFREKPENIVTLPNKSIVINSDVNGRNISFLTIENSQSFNTKTTNVPIAFQKEIKNSFLGKLEIVNTNEYVKNGAINKTQAYYENGTFMLIKDTKTDEKLEAILITPESSEPVVQRDFTSTVKLAKIKDSNNQVIDQKLYGIYLGKEDFGVSVFDIHTGNEEKKLLLSEDIAQIENAVKIKTYMKTATKSKMKTTISVNKTKSNNYTVTVSYVEKERYNYYFNDWFWMHHHQQMMLQQQQMTIPRPGGFGPSFPMYESDAFFFEEKNQSLSFTLDTDLNLLTDNTEPTKYEFIDKKRIIKNLNENKELKNTSVGFLEDEYSFLYTDKKEETLFIDRSTIIKNY
ncbi:hypothetical protein [Aequorivita sp. Q41]|uniref:hypothetical protein n=1 Tax=Aequorivita sp. Q41 TaxID=3153300 RepID=UPI003242476A